MRSKAAIETKIQLLTSKNWPEGAAWAELLKMYLKAYPVVDYATLLSELIRVVRRAWAMTLQDIPEIGKIQFKIIDAMTIVWLLGDERFIKKVEMIPYTIPALDKLMAIAEHYDIDLSSDEEE